MFFWPIFSFKLLRRRTYTCAYTADDVAPLSHSMANKRRPDDVFKLLLALNLSSEPQPGRFFLAGLLVPNRDTTIVIF